MGEEQDLNRNVEQVIGQLRDALGDLRGREELAAALGELLRIALQHERRIAELEALLSQRR